MRRTRRRQLGNPPRQPSGASGRFVLRIDPGLHEALRAAARERGVSLNDYCARRLAAPAGGCDVPQASAALARASALFHDALVGVVAFGSWVRGEAGIASDVDLLVVVDDKLSLTRDLYRRWDAAPVDWDGRLVEPHFVHLPDAGTVTGGAWAEAAIDGLVLLDESLAVSRRLSTVRRHILSGRLVRRLVHGQPYWAEVA